METETLNAIISAHIKECDARDVRNSQSQSEVKGFFKGIWDTMDKNREIDKEEKANILERMRLLEIRAAFFFGGITIVGKAFDYMFLAHK